ncbi:hypothetical protein [Enterobacter sp. CC120223-11]|uniref:hypothetical protein n=1 Tax=Enterobacter sp. CC120223-11 TaxID=1378073 RepID=UPI000BCDF0D9|nr:hypothetical protein [Enterobacter sp. CC120223-11]SNY70143.1 hypothetical protein SAMN02744775_02310 [Enterobacter sp. CC120223-11]
MSDSDDSVKQHIKDEIEEVVKDKLYNKIFGYVFISFLCINWQELFILLKSTDDVYYTLAMMETQQYFWLHHFGLPFAVGVAASVAFPWLTSVVSRLTTNAYSSIRYVDKNVSEMTVERMREIRKVITLTETDLKELQKKRQYEYQEYEKARVKREQIDGLNKELFEGLKPIAEQYKRNQKRIETEADMINFLLSIKGTPMEKDTGLYPHLEILLDDLIKLMDGEQAA